MGGRSQSSLYWLVLLSRWRQQGGGGAPQWSHMEISSVATWQLAAGTSSVCMVKCCLLLLVVVPGGGFMGRRVCNVTPNKMYTPGYRFRQDAQ